MTREEAIKVLEPFKACMFDQYGCPISDAAIALDVAIEALKEQKTGKWIAKQNDYEYEVLDSWKCSACEYAVYEKKTDYCPNCGARMEREEDD